MRAWRHTGLVLFLGVLIGCGEGDKKRPLGATCEGSEECSSGLCYAGECLDPEGDEDRDGLLNKIEAAQGSDALKADTDDDGVGDIDEYEGLVARDTDGDGLPDAAESSLTDQDEDCVVDELDVRNDESDGAASTRIAELCRTVGVCGDGAALSVMCRGGLGNAACEYGAVVGFEAAETSCDGDDNDCDNETDEGCDPLGVGLVGHWPLDGDGQDVGPHGDHGTVSGAEPMADRFGVAGKAMRFAEDGDRIEVAATEHPTGEVTATYALWVRPDRGWSFVNQGYLNFGEVLEVNKRSGLVRLAGRGCTEYVGEGNDANPTAACVPEGHWSHIAIVKSGIDVRFFVDGRMVATQSTVAGQDLQSTALVMGLSKVGTDGPVEQFHGGLDDVRVWGRALSDTEVATLASDTPAVGTRERPAQSCMHIKETTGSTTDGRVWVDIDGDAAREAFEVYCDQNTDGGGWALVWVYEFTDFENFQSEGNAVTPRPSWPVAQADTPVSTTTPTGPEVLGALDWALWRELGTAFVIKSDLADHVACEPGRGSIVHGTSGWVACRTVADVTPVCDGVVPRDMFFGPYGPSLRADDLYYYFDGNLSNNWPTHDPCGQNTPQHVATPARRGGSMWVRPGARPVEWPEECNEIGGVLRSDGQRRIDPDGPGGAPSLMAECRFDVERGGWTRLNAVTLDTLGAEATPREVLYTKGKDFYRSPVTTAPWDPKSYAEVTGLWHHQKVGTAAGLFRCDGGSEEGIGIGCGGEISGGSQVLPVGFDETTATATVCQAPPDVFGTATEGCASDVAVWTRRHYCVPDDGQILGDGGFDLLANATEPWQSPCWGAWGPDGFKSGYQADMEEFPPYGKAPSLRVDNPETGNLIYALNLSQREFSVVAGRAYTLGFWARAAEPRSMRVFVQPTTYDDGVFFEDVMLTPEWQYYALGFEARTTYWGMTIDFQLAESSTAAIWLDDVSLTEDGPSPCGGDENNVIGNGDFAHGRTCWRFGNQYTERLAGMWVDALGGPDGTAAARVELTGEPGESWYANMYRRHVPMVAGRHYRLHVTARASSEMTMGLNVNRWDLGMEPWFATEQPVSTSWRTYTHDFVAQVASPEEGANLEMAFGENVAGWVGIADVRLEVLEPNPCVTFEADTLADPGFLFGLVCWPFEWHWSELDLYASYDAEAGAVRAEISNNSGGFDYTARIEQLGRSLRGGHGYVLKFEAFAETGRRGYTNLQNWPTLHMNAPVHFEPRWKNFEVAWQQALDTTGAKLEIGFGGPQATGSTWFRGLELMDLGEAPCMRGRPDAVANGGFDRSHVCWELMRPWDEVSFEATSDATTFGNAAPSMRLDYTPRTVATNVAFSHRGLSFGDASSYVLSFKAKASAGVEPFVSIFDEAGGGQGGLYVELTTEWQTFSYPFSTFGTSPGRGVVEMQLNGQAQPVTIWIDDVAVTPAVER